MSSRNLEEAGFPNRRVISELPADTLKRIPSGAGRDAGGCCYLTLAYERRRCQSEVRPQAEHFRSMPKLHAIVLELHRKGSTSS